MAGRRVLRWELGRVEVRLVDVLVDARAVVRDVLEDARAVGSVELGQRVDHRLAVLRGVRRGEEGPLVHAGVRAAGEARERRAARVAQHVHHEEVVLRGGVARAEHHPGARAPVDVRAPEGVAHDGHIRARADRRLGLPVRHAEPRFREVLADVLLLEAGRRVEEVRVGVALVGGVLGRPSPAQELRGLNRVVVGVLPRGDDVPEAPEQALAEGLGSGRGGCRGG